MALAYVGTWKMWRSTRKQALFPRMRVFQAWASPKQPVRSTIVLSKIIHLLNPKVWKWCYTRGQGNKHNPNAEFQWIYEFHTNSFVFQSQALIVACNGLAEFPGLQTTNINLKTNMPSTGGSTFNLKTTPRVETAAVPVCHYGCCTKYRRILLPKWMVKIMENPMKIHDLGVPLFFWRGKHPYV